MIVQALLIGIWAGIAGIDLFDGLFHIHRPLVTGLVVGLILGDMKTGLIVGSTLEFVWMGLVPLAGAQPPNVVIGGIIGTSIAILGNLDAQAAVGLAVPFAVAVQAGITLLFTLFSFFMHKADQYAADADVKGIEKINYLGLVILFFFYFIIAFLPIYFGADQAANLVGMIPEWAIHALSIAGGVMPAIGFAMLLKIMLKKEYIAFLIGGFIIVAYGNLPILALALVGVAIAAYDYFKGGSDNSDMVSSNNTEDYSDGI